MTHREDEGPLEGEEQRDEFDPEELDDDGNPLPFAGPDPGPTQAEIDAWLADTADLSPEETKGIDDHGGYIKAVDGYMFYDWLSPAGEADFYRRTGNVVAFTRPTGPSLAPSPRISDSKDSDRNEG